MVGFNKIGGQNLVLRGRVVVRRKVPTIPSEPITETRLDQRGIFNCFESYTMWQHAPTRQSAQIIGGLGEIENREKGGQANPSETVLGTVERKAFGAEK